MTYRSDSDIPIPYGWLEDKRKPSNYIRTSADNTKDFWPSFDMDWKPSQKLKDMVRKKTKLVSWIVSNCWSSSHRETYVRQLMNYIPVDIMGECGSIYCDKAHDEMANDRWVNCAVAYSSDFHMSYVYYM